MRILYVEDEKFLADAVIHLLKKSKIDVDWVADGEAGLELALKPFYDVIVLDIMLPKLSGIDILKDIRKRGVKTPVIMLSALSEVDDKVRGLDAGADDYLAKPFKTSELIARLNAITRRPPLKTQEEIKYLDLTFNATERTVNGLALTDKEASILEMLIKNPEKVQPKEQILSHVWGSSIISDDNYVEVYVSYIRKKIAQLKSKATIKTIRGLGYKLCSKS